MIKEDLISEEEFEFVDEIKGVSRCPIETIPEFICFYDDQNSNLEIVNTEEFLNNSALICKILTGVIEEKKSIVALYTHYIL